MTVLRALLVVCCVVGLTACSVDRDRIPPTHERAEVPKDRDERAVLAALRSLDPCALLDPAAAGVPGTREYTGPHTCEVRESETGPVAAVAVGSRFDADAKLDENVPRPIDGVKAYVSAPRRPDPDVCAVHLPVSFRFAIRFSASNQDDTTDPCAVATAFATVAVGRLADPAELTAELPMVGWDVCALFTDALAAVVDDPDGYTATYPRDGLGLDECLVTEPGKAAATLRLTLAYDVHPSWAGGEKTLGGKQVWARDGAGCGAAWTNGAVSTGNPLTTDQVVEFTTWWDDCAYPDAIATEVISRMSAPPPAPVEPRRPVLYRADEPDLPVAGACAYLTDDAATCEPAVDVAVPDGEEAIVAAADLDPNVSCAVARAAVNRHYGRGLRPVTDPSQDTGGCHFVQPDRALSVEVTIRSGRVDEPRDAVDDLAVAGHRGWLRRLSAEAYEGQLALGEHGRIVFWVGGDGTTDELAPFLTDVLDRYFR
jgi:hypothetical protein